MRRLLFTIVLAAMLAGCSEPRVDASTDATMKASITTVRESLSPDKQAAFDNAIKVMIADMALGALGSIFTKPMSQEDMMSKFKAELDGKTADQIIARAEVVKAEIQARRNAAK